MRVVMQGLPANGAGLLRIVSCCSQLGRWDEAYAAWTVMQAAGMQPDGACLNALLAALQAAKQWQHVVQVFQAARQTQVASVGP
jgi:pentatricopeptide repeat protein